METGAILTAALFILILYIQKGYTENVLPRSTVFKNNKSQAVRLPKAVALPDTVRRVDIVKIGKARLIVPSDALWDSFFDGPAASEDFMDERRQPPEQERDLL